jgi:sugar lactone lactonase YvrE
MNYLRRGLLTPALALCLLVSCEETTRTSDDHDKPHNPNTEVIVSNIGPESGGIGTKIVVSGSNFGNDPSKVKLYFNAKEAFVMKVQDNAIYALVPKQPGDFSTIKVSVDGKEGVLAGRQFQYFVRSSVTTIAGQQGITTSVDGPALEATMGRPSMLAANDEGLVFVADDGGMRLRMISLADSKVTTLLEMNRPWQCAFTASYNKFFVLQREASGRPLLFYGLYKGSNWMESDSFYDQTDASGNFIAGNIGYAGLAVDEEYVYLLALGANNTVAKLVRVHQETKKVELIGENFVLPNWNHICFNPKDRKIYLTAESFGRIYRFDPYLTPPGHDTPWITMNDLELILGGGRGTVKEGNGTNAQFGSIEQLCFDAEGNMYVVDYQNHVVWKIDPDLNATVIAGTPGVAGYADGNPKESMFTTPYGITSTPDGILYVGEAGENRLVRCISIQ